MSTAENLAAAFAGESQANRKYLAFAKQADKVGKTQIAKLFRAAAAAETVHAHAHLRVMGGVGTLEENIQAGIDGEAHEFKEMYPEFIAAAVAEGNKAAEASFKNASIVEEIHHGLYTDALAAATAGSDLPAAAIHVCAICGNTVLGDVPDTCSVCGVPGSKFFTIE